MKRFGNLLVLSLAFAGLLLAGTAAKADTLTLTFDTPLQIGPGPLFTFVGTIAYTDTDAVNDAGATEYLNGATVVVNPSTTYDYYDYFYTNAPLYMNPGDSWTEQVIFTVTTPSYMVDASNLYSGSFTILGGTDDSTNDPLATTGFNIQVTPEPSSLLLLTSGLAGLAGMLRRRLIR